jgi:hypothetical protein
MNKLRPDLPPLPGRIARLPVDERGYPVPWFVQWLGPDNEATAPGTGRPEFRIADSTKLVAAVKLKLCWVCGEPLGRIKVAVLGPMCCITRTSSEPPSHHDCAEFSARACPFLSKPQMVRREDDLTRVTRGNVAGEMISRNPGVCALWAMKDYTLFSDGRGGALFQVGEPLWLRWYALGKPATRDQILSAIALGTPTLMEACQGRTEDLLDLGKRTGWLLKESGLIPSE